MVYNRIDITPEVMFGKPVIKGTRITVEQILRKLAAGMDEEAIIADHPRLTREDIREAMRFAADGIADEEITLAEAKQ